MTVVQFPIERSKAFKQNVERLRKLTNWWPSDSAERERLIRKAALPWAYIKEEMK